MLTKVKRMAQLLHVDLFVVKKVFETKDKRDFLYKNHWLETRTNCKTRMGVINMDGKFRVHDFCGRTQSPFLASRDSSYVGISTSHNWNSSTRD